MNQQQTKKEVHNLVNWCLDRTEEIDEADSMALLEEFDEWIKFEADEVSNVEVRFVDTKS